MEPIYIRTEKDGTKVFHDYTCDRCDGAGWSKAWAMTGGYCYKCGGSGKLSKPRVVREYTEEQINYEIPDFKRLRGKANVSSAVGIGAVRTAANLNAKAMVIPTMSGLSARLVANFRPEMPIYAVTPSERAQRQLQLDWGVLPLQGYKEDSTENIISHAMYVVTRDKYIRPGDLVVVTAGDPATNEVRGEGSMTNVMFVIEAK